MATFETSFVSFCTKPSLKIKIAENHPLNNICYQITTPHHFSVKVSFNMWNEDILYKNKKYGRKNAINTSSSSNRRYHTGSLISPVAMEFDEASIGRLPVEFGGTEMHEVGGYGLLVVQRISRWCKEADKTTARWQAVNSGKLMSELESPYFAQFWDVFLQ